MTIKNSVCDLIMLDQNRNVNSREKKLKQVSSVETPLNDNYMSIIRESYAGLLSRHELNLERRRIMTLDLDPENNIRSWNKMKKFLKLK